MEGLRVGKFYLPLCPTAKDIDTHHTGLSSTPSFQVFFQCLRTVSLKQHHINCNFQICCINHIANFYNESSHVPLLFLLYSIQVPIIISSLNGNYFSYRL